MSTAPDEAIRRFLAELSGLPVSSIADDAGLFGDLGFNSLTIIHIINYLREEFGVEIEIIDMFECTTVRGLMNVAQERMRLP